MTAAAAGRQPRAAAAPRRRPPAVALSPRPASEDAIRSTPGCSKAPLGPTAPCKRGEGNPAAQCTARRGGPYHAPRPAQSDQGLVQQRRTPAEFGVAHLWEWEELGCGRGWGGVGWGRGGGCGEGVGEERMKQLWGRGECCLHERLTNLASAHFTQHAAEAWALPAPAHRTFRSKVLPLSSR